MKLAKFPRIRLGHGPTPLEPMKNLSSLLGGPNLWIKRDDCTGLATGGNKTRKLEYLMAEALAQKADMVMTQGGDPIQSCPSDRGGRGPSGHGVPYPSRGSGR